MIISSQIKICWIFLHTGITRFLHHLSIILKSVNIRFFLLMWHTTYKSLYSQYFGKIFYVCSIYNAFTIKFYALFFEWWWYKITARYGQLWLVYNLMHLPLQTLIISLILAIHHETLLFKSIFAVQWISIEIPKAICSKTLLLCLKAVFIWLEWEMKPWFGFWWYRFSFSGINCKSYVVPYDEKWMWSILDLLTPMGTMLPLHVQTITGCSSYMSNNSSCVNNFILVC